MKNTTLKRNALLVLFINAAGGSYQACADGPAMAVVPVATKAIVATKRFVKTKAILLDVCTKAKKFGALSKTGLGTEKKLKEALVEIDATIKALIKLPEFPEKYREELKNTWIEICQAVRSMKGKRLGDIRDVHTPALTKKFAQKIESFLKKLEQDKENKELFLLVKKKINELKGELTIVKGLNFTQKLAGGKALKKGLLDSHPSIGVF